MNSRDMKNMFFFLSADYSPKGGSGQWQPSMDVFETDTAVTVALEIPGVEPADLQITQFEDRVLVCGVRRHSPSRERRLFHQIEIVCGGFEKEIRLPPSLRGSSVEARLELGILSLEILKKGPQHEARKRTIEIRIG